MGEGQQLLSSQNLALVVEWRIRNSYIGERVQYYKVC